MTGGSGGAVSAGGGREEGAGDGRGSGGDPRLGLTVRHRRYVPYSHAHYAGNLVDGAYALALFGDVATEVCIRTDSDEGLFAGYADVRFRAPIRAGDVLEVVATVTRVGTRSRTLDLECRVVCRGRPDRGGSAAEVLDPPVVAVTAVGTVVVPGAASAPPGVGTAGPPPATSPPPPVWTPSATAPDPGPPAR
ncbi:3-aminobutyryl-CoA ammonia-lyase [Plantactinospora soyae]|uniref:3-aminobutyryl-CoA ammonia-lyase n=1 Tax=Plantactinospora soyae TaxID=1544732 RepID=A0A927MAZ5_9ACTN|nr:3-aminobutyryl-CoA ammonia-lyase [Plantactinospora soyae]